MRHAAYVVAAVSFVLLAAGILWRVATRPVLHAPHGPARLPEEGFSHAAFEEILRRFTDAEGHFDYARLHADPEARRTLDGYLAALAAASPERAPERFPNPGDAEVYWLNAYNALVIAAILDHWPIETVHDVRAPVELVRGMGFFYNQRFVLGGRVYNLYELERTRAAAPDMDPRVHFVLNCGSKSCPALRPELPRGDALESFLAERARAFVEDPRNVRIDPATRTVYVSRIFTWYEDDFVRDLRRRGKPADRGIADVLADLGGPAMAERLSGEWKVEPLPYDGSLNVADREGP